MCDWFARSTRAFLACEATKNQVHVGETFPRAIELIFCWSASPFVDVRLVSVLTVAFLAMAAIPLRLGGVPEQARAGAAVLQAEHSGLPGIQHQAHAAESQYGRMLIGRGEEPSDMIGIAELPLIPECPTM